MHSAGIYQTDDYYKRLIETLLNNTPSDITINVRRPHFYKLITGNFSDSTHRIGIFNDGYLGNASDLGTFDSEFERADFINWMQTHGKYTLYGGETTKFDTSSELYSSEDEIYSDSAYVLEEMPKTHTSYLNSEFNLSILNDKWKQQNYTGTSTEYSGTKLYKYVADHLGYRFVLRESKISSSVEKGGIVGVNLKIENVGFGNIVKKQKATVILRKDNKYYEAPLDIQANNINCGEINSVNFYFYVPSNILSGEWSVYLKIANKNNSDYAIQFANNNIWDEDLLANYLGKVTIEESSAEEGMALKQAFKTRAKNGVEKTISTQTPTESKVPVKFEFHRTSNSEKISTIEKNINLGTEINFKDENSLTAIGISFPSGYDFEYAQCYKIKGDWNGYDSITIPSDSTEDSYEILVYVKEINTITVSLGFYYNSENIQTTTLNLPLGTEINFTDTNNLNTLGITIPSGRTFNFAQCYAITNDWEGHNTITIPNETNESSYWINVYLN